MAATLAAQITISAGAGPFDCQSVSTPPTRIDDLVFARLKHLQIEAAAPCSDAVFLRRANLDLIGTLPTASEAQEFLLSRDPQKRAKLVDRLLERDEFADYWAMKWSDLLRVKAEFPINLWPNAAQAYHRWIRASIKENKPYDQFARELLTTSGSNFRQPAVNFYRAMQNREPSGIAQTVALIWMGSRAEKWPTNQLAELAVFFSKVGYKSTAEWKEEIVFFDPNGSGPLPPTVSRQGADRVPGVHRSAASQGANAGEQEVTFPLGKCVKFPDDRDPREVFADWLIQPQNPWFTRNIANRVWSWLLGRGIIHEPDDLRADNPPSNPELLAYLESELVAARYDLKHLFRIILNSQTYQLSSLAKTDQPGAAANFASYPLRRLEAEVLMDAVNAITGSSEKYSSAIPEPFTFLPENQRSIALPDGSITSSFLEMFGRPSRDTGLEAERNNRPTAAQKLHLLNSSHVLRKIEQSRMVAYQTEGQKTATEIAVGMYLGIMSRFPTPEELKIIEGHFQSSKQRDAAVDLAWALINSAEFLYRH
jgi:hypothetical protein